MNNDIQTILGPTFDRGILQGDRIIRDLPFADYQALPGVNASLLKQPTAYEMLNYAVGMAALDEHERRLAELSGDTCADVLERVEMCAPRTVPIKIVKAARQLIESDKLTAPQREAWSRICEGCDSREIKGATLTALDAKGLLSWSVEERRESGVSATVKESRAMALAIGDATHKAILEPNLFDVDTWQQHWQLSPTKGLTTALAMEAAASDPRKLITPEIVDTARRCRDAVWRHKLAAELLSQPGASEVTVQAWDDQAMCWRKARIDRLPDDPDWGIVDIKTTHKGLLHQQIRGAIYSFSYHAQAAYYLDTLGMIEPKPRDHFHLIFVTKEPPFLCRCVEVDTAPPDESFVAKGRDLYLERLAMFALAWIEQAFEAYENEPLTTLRA